MAVGRWIAHELAELRRLAREGASGPEIASLLGRSTGAVQQKALELGIELVRVDQTGWRRAQRVSSGARKGARHSTKQTRGSRRRPM